MRPLLKKVACLHKFLRNLVFIQYLCCESTVFWNDQGVGRFIFVAMYLEEPQSHYTNYSLPPPPPPMAWVPYMPPYEIFPLPPCGVVALSPSRPCGVVGVWYCPPPPSVVWWGCGTVPLPLWCGRGVIWYVGYV